MSSNESFQQLVRFTSGIQGLDAVLGGGFFVGGVYIVEGVPGAGKTILANQICFHVAKQQKRVLYVTLLAESHSRLLQHLQNLRFFDASTIPEYLTYISGFAPLEEGGLKALLELVRRELRAQRPNLVVLDGFAAVSESSATDRDFKKFVHELQLHAGLASCTFFLLSSGTSAEVGPVQPVHTMVDGLVRLSDHVFGVRAEREIQIQKLRGSRYLRGVHTFDITDDGMRVYPRLESYSADLADSCGPEQMTIGIPQLDAMIGGGLRRGSITMVLGPTGIGKSTLGYRFLTDATATDKGLLFSFYETPKRALAKADAIGLELGTRCARGDVELMWQSPVEGTFDAIGGSLLEAVDRLGAKRLFIDGFDALRQAAAYPERVPQFFAALGRELHARGTTTIFSAELRQIYAPEIEAPLDGVSPLLENLFLLRFVELNSEIHRVISILKLRDSKFDPRIHEFTISNLGFRIEEGFHGEEAILTGVAHKVPDETSSKRKKSHARTKGKKRAKSTRARESRKRE